MPDHDRTATVKPITLGRLRAMTNGLPDSALLIVVSGEDDILQPYERAALGLSVIDYGSTIGVALSDFPKDAVA